MTERFQTKFSQNFGNNNIIYAGFIAGSLAVLYFYRFHFATAVFSYVVGCVACYYGLNSHILHNYVEQLRSRFVKILPNTETEDDPVIGCETCGSKDCLRHDSPVTEPWVGLQIHKQLDQAIEDFYNTIMEHFISPWYNKVTLQPFFVDELRHLLRYASACLLRRAVKINYSRFITERLLPCALRHYTLCADQPLGAHIPSRLAVHPAAASRAAEIRYLRAVANALMPHLLGAHELRSEVFRVLIREIFAGWVLLSLTDVLADPHVLNTLVVIATNGEKMSQLPTTPNYKVEFLETFARQTESVYSQRARLLRIDLELVIGDQLHFYAFMQYLKTTSHIQLLQFYKDIKSFQTRILNPSLTAHETAFLHAEACSMYARYFSPHARSALAEELRALMDAEPSSVKRLQTSRALYQEARQSHAELEKVMLPKFLHSDEFYKIFIGSRIPTGYNKHMSRRPPEKLLKLGNKLKGALKSAAIDGQLLESLEQVADGDSEDNMDILKYLDSIASEDSMRDHDLTSFKVVLTGVEARMQIPPRRGTVRVFTCTVHRAEPGAGARLWTVERSEHDFHLLRSKLHEFHGDQLLHDLPLPSRRDNSPMETVRYKYEDFLQRLLQKSLLRTSELLHLFLTVDGDFSMVVQATTLNANNTDLTNIYQSVTHKLRKEKGQHLESFLRNLLVSSDLERYQALKQGTSIVEEALEVNEDAEIEPFLLVRKHNKRNIHQTIFENNFGIEPVVEVRSECQSAVVGFTQCCMFLLIKVFQVHSVISGVIGTLLSMTKDIVDDVFERFLNRALCDLLSERRLAHLIRLGQAIIFGKKPPTHTDPVAQRELALARLLERVPAALAFTRAPLTVRTAFEIVQVPQLNKQLVYNLLDLCLLELFPELSATDKSKEPKS